MALWCSRLARQPVTLEVDGSSPFGVAKNENHRHLAMVFVFITQQNGLERRLLATVRWTVATAVAFLQKSESVRGRQNKKQAAFAKRKCGLYF